MLMSQFFTLGLLSLTTAGGAIGGYLARSRKDQLEGPEYKMIEGVEVVDEQPRKLADQSATDSVSTETTVSIEPESIDSNGSVDSKNQTDTS